MLALLLNACAPPPTSVDMVIVDACDTPSTHFKTFVGGGAGVR
jgi:hypothetical protein